MVDTLAGSYIHASGTAAGNVAGGTSERKEVKYSAISQTHTFVPLAGETVGLINQKGVKCLSELANCLTLVTDDPGNRHFCFNVSLFSFRDSRQLAFKVHFINQWRPTSSRSRDLFLINVFNPRDLYYRGYKKIIVIIIIITIIIITLGQFIRRCFWDIGYTARLPLMVGEGSLSFIGVMQTQVRNTCSV